MPGLCSITDQTLPAVLLLRRSQREEVSEMQLLSAICYTSCISGSYSLPTQGNVKKEAQNQVPKKKHQLQYFKSLVPPLMAAIIALSPLCNTPVSLGQTIDVQRGASLFRRACIGCHVGGGNIIQPGATLFTEDLQRNGIEGEEEIYNVTYYGKGRMPGFGENCTPRGQCTFGARLLEEEIKVLAKFVKLQADQGWPNIESSEDCWNQRPFHSSARNAYSACYSTLPRKEVSDCISSSVFHLFTDRKGYKLSKKYPTRDE